MTNYEKLLNIEENELEELAYDIEKHTFQITDLSKRYKEFRRAKRLLKIIELLREEKENV